MLLFWVSLAIHRQNGPKCVCKQRTKERELAVQTVKHTNQERRTTQAVIVVCRMEKRKNHIHITQKRFIASSAKIFQNVLLILIYREYIVQALLHIQ